MLFDPDSSLSREQILEKVWRELTPELQARCRRVMVATGQSWDELCRECRSHWDEIRQQVADDPDCPLARQWDFEEFPRGHDPLVEQSEP